MTVAELIAKLQEMPQEANVAIRDVEYFRLVFDDVADVKLVTHDGVPIALLSQDEIEQNDLGVLA